MTRDEAVRSLTEKARILYEGKQVKHRSCGIAIAETFDRPSGAYQALRKGGLTGDGPCGAILAGQLVLGELLGDPDPTGPATEPLKQAMARYRAEVAARLPAGDGGSRICNDLTARFPVFTSPERAGFCTDLAARVAEIVAEIAWDFGARVEPSPVGDR